MPKLAVGSSQPQPRAFSEVLASLGHGDEQLTVGEIVDAFAERGFGAVMLIIAIVNLLPWPPGGTTIAGAPLVLLAAELALGRDQLWLPGRLMRASVNRSAYRKATERALPVLRRIENLTRPRLSMLTKGVGQTLIAIACLLLSLVLVLPIWLGNLAPAFAIALFSLGLMQRDGWVAIAGWVATAISVGLLVLAWTVIVASVMNAWTWATGFF